MRAKEFTFNQSRRKLNIPELIKHGAIFITHPHGPDGWETDRPDWDFSLITLQNVLQKSPDWVVDYKKYITKDKKLTQNFIDKISDQKYQQILWSIEKLGIPDKVAFLDQQGVAEGSGFEQEAGIGIDGKSFKFKIKDLVAFAEKYPVTKVNPKEFIQQIKGRDEDPTQSMARAEKADLQYPIIVVKRKNGQLWIADGTHRAHKAILNKLPTINAKIIPIDDMESFEIKKVDEAPLPPDWDKEQLNLRQTFKNRIKYAVSKAQRLGTGSSRVAFIIPYEGRNTVLKVAKNLKGLAQNEAEIQILDDWVIGKSDIVIPLIDYDKDNNRPVWLQTEMASKIGMRPLLQLLRTPTLWFLTDAVKYRLSLPDKPKYLNKPADLKEKYFDPKMWTYGGEPSEQSFEMFNEYVDKLSELKDSSQIELGDLQNNLNWGQFMGRPVVIDLGLSSEVWSKYYLLK